MRSTISVALIWVATLASQTAITWVAFDQAGRGISSVGSGTIPALSMPARDRTIRIAGGQVSVRCTRATILLRSAEPDNGWRVEVGAFGPGGIQVRFQRVDDSAGREARVTAVCSASAPAFRVKTEGA